MSATGGRTYRYKELTPLGIVLLAVIIWIDVPLDYIDRGNWEHWIYWWYGTPVALCLFCLLGLAFKWFFSRRIDKKNSEFEAGLTEDELRRNQSLAYGFGGGTALHYAVYRNEKKVAELFLATSKLLVNAKDDLGDTALHYAIFNGNSRSTDMVKLLLANGADVNARNGKGDTPLDIARRGGWHRKARVLRKHGGLQE
jgi:hypothetical protein